MLLQIPHFLLYYSDQLIYFTNSFSFLYNCFLYNVVVMTVFIVIQNKCSSVHVESQMNYIIQPIYRTFNKKSLDCD